MTQKRIHFGWLTITVVALPTFGMVAQILCELMGNALYLRYFVCHLLFVCFVGVITYSITRFCMKRPEQCREFAYVLGSIVLLWTLLIGCFYISYQLDPENRYVFYGDGSYLAVAEQSAEVRYMISKCHLFQKGEPYFEHLDPSVSCITSEMMDKATEVFWNYRGEMLLPVLSYTYGLWVIILYAILVLCWCIGVVKSFSRVKGKKSQFLYGGCVIVLTIHLIGSLLGGLGFTIALIPPLFSMEWELDLLNVAPQVGVMLALSGEGKRSLETEVGSVG